MNVTKFPQDWMDIKVSMFRMYSLKFHFIKLLTEPHDNECKNSIHSNYIFAIANNQLYGTKSKASRRKGTTNHFFKR